MFCTISPYPSDYRVHGEIRRPMGIFRDIAGGSSSLLPPWLSEGIIGTDRTKRGGGGRWTESFSRACALLDSCWIRLHKGRAWVNIDTTLTLPSFRYEVWDLAEWLEKSDSQCRSRNCPGFDPSVLRHSGKGAADESVLNKVLKKKIPKNPLYLSGIVLRWRLVLHLILTRNKILLSTFSCASFLHSFFSLFAFSFHAFPILFSPFPNSCLHPLRIPLSSFFYSILILFTFLSAFLSHPLYIPFSSSLSHVTEKSFLFSSPFIPSDQSSLCIFHLSASFYLLFASCSLI